MSLVVRPSSGEVPELEDGLYTATIMNVVHDVDKDLPIVEVAALDDVLAGLTDRIVRRLEREA